MINNPFLREALFRQSELSHEEKRKDNEKQKIEEKWGWIKGYIEKELLSNIPITRFSFNDIDCRDVGFQIQLNMNYISVVFGSYAHDFYRRADGKNGRLLGIDYRRYRDARMTESGAGYEIRIFGGSYVSFPDRYGYDKGVIFSQVTSKEDALNALLEACGRCYVELR